MSRRRIGFLPSFWFPNLLNGRLQSSSRVTTTFCRPAIVARTSVLMMELATAFAEQTAELPIGWADDSVDALVARLFREEGSNLVRLARFFVDDRTAAEDLVQEAFIKLSRSVQRIHDEAKVPAYLRSIVLNLARDHNRRGLVSLRHRLPADVEAPSIEEQLAVREDQQRVIDALRQLPHRQRDCLVLRYYNEDGIAEIAETLRLSANSVKTHLQRGLRSLEKLLGEEI